METLDRAVEDAPQVAALWYLRAFYRGRTGDIEGGIADASRAIELSPADARAWNERGYLRRLAGQLDAALQDLDRAVELDPAQAHGWGDRGDLRKERGDLLGAIGDYDRALALQPDFGPAIHNRALARMGLGDWSAAVQDQRRAIPLCDPMARMWLVLASAEENLGHFAGVMRSCKRALAFDDENAVEARRMCADAAWLRGRGSVAVEMLDAALEADGSPAAVRAMLHQVRGSYRMVLGRDEEARADFAEAAALPGMVPWAACMRWCASRGSDAGGAELQRTFAGLGTSLPPGMERMLDVCLGPQPLPSGWDEGLPNGLRCMAWFLLGWRHRLEGRADEASSCFERCLATGRRDMLQWRLAFTELGFAGPRAPLGSFGCAVRARADTQVPEVEVVAVDEAGAAASQGIRVGMRLRLLNGEPVTEALFAATAAKVAVGTPVRFDVVDQDGNAVRWLVAGPKRD